MKNALTMYKNVSTLQAKEAEMEKKKEVPLTVKAFFVRCTQGVGNLSGFGNCAKGVWTRVPERIYQDIALSVGAGATGWEVKVGEISLEDKS
jgi:hypothetical protein